MGKKKYVSSLDYTVRYCTSMKTEILDNIIYKSELIRRCRTNSLGVEIVAMVLGAKTASFENFPKGLSEICFWYPTAGGRNIIYRVISNFLSLSLILYDFLLRRRVSLKKKKKFQGRKRSACEFFFAFACPSYSFFFWVFAPFLRKRKKRSVVIEEEREGGSEQAI